MAKLRMNVILRVVGVLLMTLSTFSYAQGVSAGSSGRVTSTVTRFDDSNGDATGGDGGDAGSGTANGGSGGTGAGGSTGGSGDGGTASGNGGAGSGQSALQLQ